MATKAAPAPKAKAAPKDDIDAEIEAQLGEIESGDVDADEENPDEASEESAEDGADAPEEAIEDGETEEDAEEAPEEEPVEAAEAAPEEDGAEDEPAPAKPVKSAKGKPAAAKAAPEKPAKAAPAPAVEEAPAKASKTGKALQHAKADAEATPAAKAVKNAKAKPTQTAKAEADKVAPEAVPEVVEPAPVPEADEDGNYDPLRVYVVPFHAISVPKARRQREEGDYSAESVKSLAEDITKIGLLHPPVIAPTAKGGKFTLEAGERRLRAMESLGWPGAHVRIMPSPDKATSVLRGLSENFQRKNIDPISEAKYLQSLLDAKVFESVAKLAAATGYDAGGVGKKLSLLGLDADTQAQIRAGTLGASAGYVIAAQAKKAEAAAKAAKEAAKTKAKETAKAKKPEAPPEEIEEDAEEAGEAAAEEVKAEVKAAPTKRTAATEAAKKAGRPLKHLSMKDIASPAVPLSDAVDLKVVRQPDDTFDLEIRIQVGLGKAEKFSAESFNIEKALADAAKTEFGAMKKKIGVGIESMLRIFTAKAKPEKAAK